MNDIKTLVLLKYQILTEDYSTWRLCETYPEIVRLKWALRCARDVEHIANKYPAVKRCNDTLEMYINGKASKEEVEKAAAAAAVHAVALHAVGIAAYAAYAAANAAVAAKAAYAADAANASYAVSNAAAAGGRMFSGGMAAKWKQYIDWLIEELCEYERNKI
jgi:hypothetical protein